MNDDGDGTEGHDEEVIITVPADMQAGVWANWAAINESDHTFWESLLLPNCVRSPCNGSSLPC